MTGLFITFEGSDGSGKTTQIQQTAAFLEAAGCDVLVTREPGGTPIGQQIRQILLDDMTNTDMHPRTELLLFCASRAQIVEQVLRPHVAQGGIVLCDRYADSTLAYQGYGHGLDVDVLRQILDFATARFYPNLTFYLDLPPSIGLERRRHGEADWNRLDDMEAAFHERVYQGYEQLIAAEPKRWSRVDANRRTNQIQADIRTILVDRGVVAEPKA